MIAKNCSVQELEKALAKTNEKYNDNIRFNRYPEPIGKQFRFTLRCKDSKEAGHKVGHTGRRLIAACWHVHGDFFEALFEISPDAEVKAGTRTITDLEGNWQDWNIGSMVVPLMYSEACNCNGVSE